MAKINEDDRELLTAYLDGEMDDDQSHALEARLGREPELRAELNAMRQAWGLLDYLPRAQPSPSFTERTMSRLSVEKMPSAVSSSASASKVAPIASPPQWGLRFGLAASVLLAMLGGFAAGAYFLPRSTAEADEALVRHLHTLEHLPEYEWADDIEFLRSIDRPDLFGAGSGL
jgi:anti-sigma factor RsiW